MSPAASMTPVPSTEPSADLREKAAQLARTGRTTELLGVIGRGLSVDAADYKGDGLLMLAAYHGHAETVGALLAAGADPRLRNAKGLSPLDGAAFKGDLAVMRALVEGGAEVDAAGPDGRTALMWATAFNRSAAVEVLLGLGADPGKVDAHGLRAEDHARAMGASECVRLLERRGE